MPARRPPLTLPAALLAAAAGAAGQTAPPPCFDNSGKTNYPLSIRLHEDKHFWNRRVLHMIRLPAGEAQDQRAQTVLGLSRKEARAAIAAGRREHGWRMLTGSSGMVMAGFVPLQLGRHSQIRIRWQGCMSPNLGIAFCSDKNELCKIPIYYDKKNGQVIQFFQARRIDKKKKQSAPHLLLFKRISFSGHLDESKGKVSIAGTRRALHEFENEILAEQVEATIAFDDEELTPRIQLPADGKVYQFDDESIAKPRVLRKVDPEYSQEAREAKRQGTVELALEVWEDGRPHNIRVTGGLGMGLDEKAVEAASRWRFEPGQKDGKPVRVAVDVRMQFRVF